VAGPRPASVGRRIAVRRRSWMSCKHIFLP
jgi:hypothetical protein